MAKALVECVPNFSEARRGDIIEQIVASIRDVQGVTVLDRHSDLDHNRTVVTFVGDPDAVEQAAFSAIQKAAELIDLDHHIGEHPRIGATDVVPFIPIQDVSMVDCVEIARRLGRRVGEELGIPVYLYEEAATRPERQNLEYLRRGQYEALKVEITTDADRVPDYGPSIIGKAGATVIGARHPLIAYNIFLSTDDVSIAQNIARAVRQSSGGLRYVKALGLLVDGRAQVSMNLTNYRQTPLARVVEMVRREAERYGTTIHHSELVGLIPQEALTAAAQWYMQLDQFETDQVLEERLTNISTEKGWDLRTGEDSFLDTLAAGTPTPGGGSAAAMAGALSAALASMVARVTLGKKKYAHLHPRMWQIVEKADLIREQFSKAVIEDASGFERVIAAMRLAKDTPEQQAYRQRSLDQAMLEAAEVPIQVGHLALESMAFLVELAETGLISAISDAATGVGLARAAFDGAYINVKTNVKDLVDEYPSAKEFLEEMEGLKREVATFEKTLAQSLKERAGLP